jgi:hypothetical protein
MKKRILLILTVGVCFSPSLYALDGVGPIDRSDQASAAGAAHCSGEMVAKNSEAVISNVRKDLQAGNTKAGNASAGPND